jgi:ribulose kinase
MMIKVLNVDGGASRNDFLMQFQSDMLKTPLRRPKNTETTALGAAYLAGLSTGFWEGTEQLHALRRDDDTYLPVMEGSRHAELLAGWHRAVARTMSHERVGRRRAAGGVEPVRRAPRQQPGRTRDLGRFQTGPGAQGRRVAFLI